MTASRRVRTRMLPLQFIDSILLNYHVGQALLLAFLLTLFGLMLVKRSRTLLSLHVMLFGIVFVLTPQGLVPVYYLFLGIVLIVVGPLLYATAER